MMAYCDSCAEYEKRIAALEGLLKKKEWAKSKSAGCDDETLSDICTWCEGFGGNPEDYNYEGSPWSADDLKEGHAPDCQYDRIVNRGENE